MEWRAEEGGGTVYPNTRGCTGHRIKQIKASGEMAGPQQC